MTEHRVGTREEWQAARDDLAKVEAEQAARNEEVKQHVSSNRHPAGGSRIPAHSFRGVWLVAAQIPAFRIPTERTIVAGAALAVAGVLLIVATHWGHFGRK